LGQVLKLANVRCGVDLIYHCEHADSEALDLLEAEKHRVFIGPGGMVRAEAGRPDTLGSELTCVSAPCFRGIFERADRDSVQP